MIRHSLDFAEFDTKTGRALVYGYPYAYRSAFLNQYFENAVRSSHPEGTDVLYRASLFANYRVLRRVREILNLGGTEDFLNFLEEMFMSLGYGKPLVSKKDIKLIASPIAQTHLYVHHTPSPRPLT